MIKTKIVATIGPSTWDITTLKKMYRNGFRVARLNSAFADYAELKRIKALVHSVSPQIAMDIDTEGPKIRIKLQEKFPITLKKNSELIISTDSTQTTYPYVTYSNLHKDISVGTNILVDDGNIRGIVQKMKDRLIHIKILNSGTVTDGKTINVPYTKLSVPLLTKRDKENIKNAVKLDYNYIGTSFVQTAADLKSIRRLIKGSNIGIIAKIETAESLSHLDEIIEEADAIMIARGDLGVEIPLHRVPLIQKKIIRKCKQAGKPVIVATQMLESMKKNPRPTRAEVSDVANAILDGADAVMLSAESSIGEYPAEAVSVMQDVAIEVEDLASCVITNYEGDFGVKRLVVRAALEIAAGLDCNYIIVYTQSGFTARLLSSFLPEVPIIALTQDKSVMQKLSLVRGVNTVLIKGGKVPTDRDEFVKFVVSESEKIYQIKSGSNVLILNISNQNKQSNNLGIIEIYKNI
ncbi:pyruvate kinase [Candidatus Dojkabacteria bacterium]|nr:pyruvate kinase [Candidatus Dojkabacteria bacterium]